MACSINVEFSSESKRALDEIAEMKDMANALSAFGFVA